MADNVGILTTLDQLLPTEKLRDSKERVGVERRTQKKDGRKRQQETDIPVVQQEGEEVIESSKDQDSGKILDLVI